MVKVLWAAWHREERLISCRGDCFDGGEQRQQKQQQKHEPFHFVKVGDKRNLLAHDIEMTENLGTNLSWY